MEPQRQWALPHTKQTTPWVLSQLSGLQLQKLHTLLACGCPPCRAVPELSSHCCKTIKEKQDSQLLPKYECFNLKLQGISSTSMHTLMFHGYIRLLWIEFICLPHTLTVDLVLHFMVWLSEAAHWYVQDNERLEISKSQEMWRKSTQMHFLKKPTTNPYIS